MGIVWSSLVYVSAFTAALQLLLALFLYLSAPGRLQNRRLATMQFVGGVITTAYIFRADKADDAFRLGVVQDLITFAVPIAYLRFLATLETPLVKPLKTRLGDAIILSMGVVGGTLLLIHPPWFVGPAIVDPSTGQLIASNGPYFPLWQIGAVLTLLFSLLVSISTFRRAPRGSIVRQRAKAYVIAFGTFDVLLLTLVAVAPTLQTGSFGRWWLWTYVDPFNVVNCIFVVLISYAILKTQLFDIDVKIKWGAARGTVAGFIVILALIVSKITEFYLNRTLGIVFGGMAAGLTLFLAPRLNRFVDKVADKAAPKVSGSSEYMSYRKLEVYRAAFESALEGGNLLEKERGTLDRLQRKLGLRPEDASAVEVEVRDLFGHAQPEGSVPASGA